MFTWVDAQKFARTAEHNKNREIWLGLDEDRTRHPSHDALNHSFWSAIIPIVFAGVIA